MRATYRLQLGPGLDFAAVERLVPYLRDLGVSHLYLSPSLQARRGSTHGYDVCDPSSLSNELGGEHAFRSLAAAAREAGLGIVMDIVPNHMYAGDENPWWADPELRAKYFDVDPETGFYRRFFDIDDLAALRQEDPEVFEASHAKVLALVAEGLVDGLRIDHPDGLADPAGYLARLRERGVERVWVEKILEADETLRDWPVSGTVGYEFLNDVAALWVDPAGEAALTDLWASFDSTPWPEHVARAKLEQASTTFSREVERLGEPASAEAVAALPIYRTYVEPWSGRVEAADRAAIGTAGLPDALVRRLTLEEPGHEEFVTRFQQTTPPVMAKGVEDTAFYRYLRLLALNEVGGDPGRFGLSLEAFHERQAERVRRFPEGLLVTQTHDTKRSGDVRARIGALSGMADEWAEAVATWRRLNAPLHDGEAPDPVEEYLIYQTLVGVWPITPERLEEYLVKALREGKRNTTWVDQDEGWERRVVAFATGLLTYRPFLEAFEPFQARVAEAGREALLGQLLVKLTSPGVADVYQGDELLSLSLVDPDNRRAVDWERRRELLDAVRGGADPTPETEKLWLIHHALALRAREPEAFAGGYAALDAGPDAVAYTRGSGAILVMARLRGSRALVPPGRGGWRDVLDRRLGDGLVLAERAG